ncbi:TPA: hypothetical protein ENS27_20245 [bacterium]|nr:hypothetical protein [bacterium]
MNHQRANTDWFRDAKWGVFTHYLTGSDMSAKDWNNRVNSFDVKALADQLSYIATAYYFITIGQNSGHYCSPNSTYDKYVEICPSKCSERDLIKDIYEALEPKGIKLLVYLPSGAPAADLTSVEKLGWKWGYNGNWPAWGTGRTGERLADFQKKWEEIISEWSIRWGKNVWGWWIDGCYFSDEMYRHSEPPNFQSFSSALKAGNPESIVAYNPGVLTPVISLTEYEDYTAGEISDAFPVCPGRRVNGAQYHILSYLGNWWGGGEPRFPDEFVIGYTKHVNSKDGVVTWDIPISETGSIPDAFINQLLTLKNATR